MPKNLKRNLEYSRKGGLEICIVYAMSIIFLIRILLLLHRYCSDDYYDYYVSVLSVVKRKNMETSGKGPHKKDSKPRALLNKRILFIICLYLLHVFYARHNRSLLLYFRS